MKVFSKEKFIEAQGKYTYDNLFRDPSSGKTWVDEADGAEVKDGRAEYYAVCDEWCVEVEEKENQKMTIKDFTEKKIAVIIKKKHDLKRFLAMCDEAGLKWLLGDSALKFEPRLSDRGVALIYGLFVENAITYCDATQSEHLKSVFNCTIVDVSEFFRNKETTKYQIIIECDGGKTTTARMIVDGREVKHAKARRSPDDKFSLATGAKIAFDRLFEKE